MKNNDRYILDGRYEIIEIDGREPNSLCDNCDLEKLGCCSVILNEYGVDCSDGFIFKKVKQKINCNRNNIKIGDTVFNKRTREQHVIVFIYRNVDKVVVESKYEGITCEHESYIDELLKYED